MIQKNMRKEDLIDELAKRTEFFKINIKAMIEAYSEILMENLESATEDEDSTFVIAPGIEIHGRRVMEHTSKDPRTGEEIITPTKVIPYAVFKRSIRDKLKNI